MYKVNTKEASELILYAVDPLPEVNDISMEKTEYSNTDNKVTINWDGNANMSELEKWISTLQIIQILKRMEEH